MSENTSDRRRRRKPQFNPGRLFANGEQGAWYDPSDFATLYQDSAGTTPVTALGQPVGLMLDKSQGAVVSGPELVTNGDFSDGTTGWVSGSTLTATAAVVNEALEVTATVAFGRYLQTFNTVAGATYVVSAQVRKISGFEDPYLFVALSGEGDSAIVKTASTSFVNLQLIFTATGSTTKVGLCPNSNGGVASIDNVSVREIPGNHASQSTSTARPTVQARVNLSVQTQDVTNWTVTSYVEVSAESEQGPLGTGTVQSMRETISTGQHYISDDTVAPALDAGTYTMSVYAKIKAGTRYLQLRPFGLGSGVAFANFDLTTGSVVSGGTGGTGLDSASIESVGDGWYRCIMTATFASSGGNMMIIMSNGTGELPLYAGDTTSAFYVYGPQVEVGTSATTYQRVTTATDYEDIGLPRYLEFDGVDDAMSTASVDFSATDEMSVFAGVEKLSDATVGIIAELSTTSGVDGYFSLYTPEAAGFSKYVYGSRGTSTANVTSNNHPAPDKAVITGKSNISEPSVSVRHDGVTENSSTATQGTGNYGNHPLYIGARNNGASFEFNGRIHQLIIRGATTDGSDLIRLEDYVANKTGVTL